jgi:hypothetical protein
METNMRARVVVYRNFLEANGKALSLLLNLKDANTGSGKSVVDELSSVTYNMIGLAKTLAGEKNEKRFWQKYNPKVVVMQLENKRREIFASNDMQKNKDLIALVSGSDCDPFVKGEVVGRVVTNLNAHNPQLDGEFDLAKMKVDRIKTPHDLIRYTHRFANHSFFDPDALKWEGAGGTTYQKGKDHFSVSLISSSSTPAKSIVESNPFLARLTKIIDSRKFKNSKHGDTISFKTLEHDGNLSMQLGLGCHYASFTIENEGTGAKKGTRINLSFVDTDHYSSSEFRSDLAHRVLNGLGLKVERLGHSFRASGFYKNEAEALDTYEMMLRFSVSIKDADMLYDKDYKGRLDEACNAFFSGVLNIYGYLGSGKTNNYVNFAKARGNYLDPKKAYKNIPSLRDFKCHPKPKKHAKKSKKGK